jgi:hypothetical protein
VVTLNGKPVAVLSAVLDGKLEDLILRHSRDLRSILKRFALDPQQVAKADEHRRGLGRGGIPGCQGQIEAEAQQAKRELRTPRRAR